VVEQLALPFTTLIKVPSYGAPKCVLEPGSKILNSEPCTNCVGTGTTPRHATNPALGFIGACTYCLGTGKAPRYVAAFV
jgi:DnaJ-class molecular chaperone